MTEDTRYLVQAPEKVKEELFLTSPHGSECSSMHVIHKAIVKQLHEKRQGSANCKTRSHVKGGGRKPWKQKGTGRARAGSNRSPLWRGGGVIFGPKTKNYHQKINKKEKRLAVRSILLNKKDFIIVIESFVEIFDKPKTKVLISSVTQLNISKTEKILFIVAKKSNGMHLATRNLNNVEIVAANQLNLLSIIKAKYILLETKAIEIITETYNG